MAYDSDYDDNDLVDDEELFAFAARHGFAEEQSEEHSDEDEELLQSVRDQVGRVFPTNPGSRVSSSQEQYQEEEDETVIQSLQSLCDRVEKRRAEETRPTSEIAKGSKPISEISEMADLQPSTPNQDDEGSTDSPSSITAAHSFLFGESAVRSEDGGGEKVRLLQHALDKNRRCQEMLKTLLTRVQEKKKENEMIKRRVKTLASFERYCKRRVFSVQGSDAQFVASLASLSRSKNFVGPEENKDVEAFRNLKSSTKLASKEWSDKESEALREAVRFHVQKHLMVQAMQDALFEIDTGKTLEERESEINNISDADIRKMIDVVNWEAVAKCSVPGRTPTECKARWLNFEDKLLNHGPWSKDEDLQLLSIAKDYEFSNWGAIAEKLGTHRTAAQCLTRYQRSLNANLLLREWTNEDDEKLKAAVDLCGEKDWEAVAACLEGRTAPQAMHRWKNVLQNKERKRGRWSVEEDRRLKFAVLICGAKEWKKIAVHVPGRTESQCRERWKNVLDPELKHGEWDEEEDERLEKAVEKYGKHSWRLVSEEMKPRTDNQCYRRWMALHKESREEFHKEVEMKRTLCPSFGRRKKERPDLQLSEIISAFCDKQSEVEVKSEDIGQQELGQVDIGRSLVDLGQLSSVQFEVIPEDAVEQAEEQSMDVGQVSVDVGQSGQDTGQVSVDVGQSGKDIGQVSVDVGQSEKDIRQVKAGQKRANGQTRKRRAEVKENAPKLKVVKRRRTVDAQVQFVEFNSVAKEVKEAPKKVRAARLEKVRRSRVGKE